MAPRFLGLGGTASVNPQTGDYTWGVGLGTAGMGASGGNTSQIGSVPSMMVPISMTAIPSQYAAVTDFMLTNFGRKMGKGAFISTARVFLALISLSGLAACVLALTGTFFPSRADMIFLWIWPLLGGVFALGGSIYLFEYPSGASDFWKRFVEIMPWWFRFSVRIIAFLGLGQLGSFVVRNGWGSPTVLDGVYVLKARGQILRVLTQDEYLKLLAQTARFFSTMIFGFYFVFAFYYCYPRANRLGRKTKLH